MAARLPEIERPVVLQGALAELPELLALRGESGRAVRCDRGARRAQSGTIGSPRRRRGHGDSDTETSVLSAPCLCG